jgi:hypothetical protein
MRDKDEQEREEATQVYRWNKERIEKYLLSRGVKFPDDPQEKRELLDLLHLQLDYAIRLSEYYRKPEPKTLIEICRECE